MAWESELAVALRAAKEAGALALRYRREGVVAEDKSDDSPVTVADRESEKLIVGLLERAYPGDGLLGEEGASRDGASGRKWIIDPIDGTRDYMRGNRMWCNLIGLEAGGETVVGVVHFPALGETYWATKGGGAFQDGQRIGVSAIAEPSRAVVCYNSLNRVLQRPHAEKVLPFLSKFWAARSFGGAMDAALVCAGKAELWIEPTAKPWDLAALRVLALESGARYFDYAGRDTIYGGNAVVCTPGLESAAREFLGL